MRIPLTKIHRAFPELDRFTEEQCTRFVSAAVRRGWRPWIHRVVITVLFLPLLVGSLFAAGFVAAWLEDHARLGDFGYWAAVGSALGAGFLVPVLIVMLVRDRLLLGRIRHIVRDRAVCPSCRYSLLGILVGEGNLVICPECGMQVEADPSMKELVTDEQGRTRFQPSERVTGRVFWTERRARVAKRATKIGAAVLFVVLPTALGGYELFLRWQAARAASERPGIDGVMAYVESHQPPGVAAGEANTWDALCEVIEERQLINDEITLRPEYADPDDGYPVYPGWETIYSPQEYDDPDEAARAALERRLCDDLLIAYRRTGLLDRLDAIAEAPRSVETIDAPRTGPVLMARLPNLGQTRALARINAARMYLAGDDREEFLGAYESSLALARHCSHQAPLIQSLVGVAIESLANDQARRRILSHPPAEWLDGIEAAAARQATGLGAEHTLEGERLYMLDAVAWMFSVPKNVRLGRFSKAVRGLSGSGGNPLRGRLGTYAENRDTINKHFDAIVSTSSLEPHARPLVPAIPSKLVLVEYFMPAMYKYLRSVDTRESDRRALAVMIALERYYLAHAAYPESLGALVPDQLTALPTDPWTGQPLGYERAGDGYELWGAGPEAGVTPASERRGLEYSPAED